ncbi:MAG TPA: DASS family sodium-coupled anion symporter [Chitinophagales bacterium]|nr:DASS family sodium-coupled anion symporter [Chitinophagales bacterium]
MQDYNVPQKTTNITAVVISIVLFCALLSFPILENQQAQHALALLVLVAILWITEAIPLALTGLLIPVIAVFTQLASPKEAFSEFGHPIVFLFMGGFVLAGALSKYSLDKRLAQKLIGLAKGNFYWSSILLMLATSLIACWVNNTSSAAMMIPLGIGMLVLSKRNMVSRESKFLMLGIAYAANIGGIITMIATPPNAIGAAILGLSFSEWLMYGVPIFLITFPLMVVVLTLYFRPDRKLNIGTIVVQYEKKAPNKTLLAIFLFTASLWVLDGIIAPLLNIKEGFNSMVAVMAIFLLFITKVLDWEEIIKSIRWSVLLLLGGGLTLGMLIDRSGLGMIMVSKVSMLVNVIPLFFFLWIIVVFSIIVTEFMSNTASAALILPLLFTMSNQLDINPMILVFPATIAASYGFMMPVGTPPNAMVFATGLVPQKSMLKAGFLLNLLFSIILTLFFYLIFS